MNTRRWTSYCLLVLAGLFGTAGVAAAQEGTIVGTVRTETGEPVAGGQVIIYQGDDAGASSRGMLTEQNGRFLFLRVPAGAWNVRVELIGYGSASQSVQVVAGETVSADIVLTSEAIALTEIVVEGIKTNIPLHQEIFQHSAFQKGGTDIHYLEKRLGL